MKAEKWVIQRPAAGTSVGLGAGSGQLSPAGWLASHALVQFRRLVWWLISLDVVVQGM